MIKIKKIFFLILKSTIALVVLLTLLLFFYAAIFYEATDTEIKVEENKIINEEEKIIEKTEEKKSDETKPEKKITEATQEKIEPKKINIPIKDGLFAIVGDRAITKSDIVNEIKIILILNNESYSDDKKDVLQKMAIKSSIERNIKQIEINKLSFLTYKQEDFINEITRLANRINIDVETLKNICASNDLDFKIIEDQIKTQLLWNSLIFNLYKDRLTINLEEIEEQLTILQEKKQPNEYLISEIIIKPTGENNIETEIKELINKIKIHGFEKVAKDLSISKSAELGGDLGWLNENAITEEYRNKINKTPLGQISEPIILQEGILFFKVRDKRKIKMNVEKEKDQLVWSEKTKILNMHSASHYDKLKRSVSIKFLDE